MSDLDAEKALSVFKDKSKRAVLLTLYDEKASLGVEIAKTTGLSLQDLKSKIDELLQDKLVEQMPLSQGNFYALTKSGSKVVEAFKNLEDIQF